MDEIERIFSTYYSGITNNPLPQDAVYMRTLRAHVAECERKAREEGWDGAATCLDSAGYRDGAPWVRERNPYRLLPPIDPRALAAAKEWYASGDGHRGASEKNLASIIEKHMGAK